MKLILASASIGREYLLKSLKIPYRIIPSQIDEDKITGKNLVETIKLRAKLKGENVAAGLLASSLKSPKLLKSLKDNREYLILSADTEVILGDKLLGKPKDYKDAFRMLKILSGKTHEVVTAVFLLKLSLDSARDRPRLPKSLKKLTFDRSFVTFRNLTDEDIRLYLSVTEYTRYTGSYALIASPQNFITKIEGSISNVIGLSLEKVIPIFRENKLL